ncbi:mycofactocin precursor MftA [Streptomyces sp. NPDC001508]
MGETNAGDADRTERTDTPEDHAPDADVLADSLIEDVSIDGMCGVY